MQDSKSKFENLPTWLLAVTMLGLSFWAYRSITDVHLGLYFYKEGFYTFFGSLIVISVLEMSSKSSGGTSLSHLISHSNNNKINIFYNLITLSPFAAVFSFLFSFGVLTLMSDLFRRYSELQGLYDFMPVWLAIIVAFVISDFIDYWVHRWFHTIPILWHLHQTHHTAQEMNVFVARRNHFIEIVLGDMFRLAPQAVLSLDAKQCYFFWTLFCLDKFRGLFIHSRLKWNYGKLLSRFFNSPGHHWIHHSTHPEHHTKNLGRISLVWDQLFGTYHPPYVEKMGPIEIGLIDSESKCKVDATMYEETIGRSISWLQNITKIVKK